MTSTGNKEERACRRKKEESTGIASRSKTDYSVTVLQSYPVSPGCDIYLYVIFSTPCTRQQNSSGLRTEASHSGSGLTAKGKWFVKLTRLTQITPHIFAYIQVQDCTNFCYGRPIFCKCTDDSKIQENRNLVAQT